MTIEGIHSRLPITKKQVDPRAPMASAPLVYNDDQSVAWDRMWDSFCVLASAGGPPHRGAMLHAQTGDDPNSPSYQAAVAEIVRGIKLVSGLRAHAAGVGWVAVECESATQARWLSEQINLENVAALSRDDQLLLPVGQNFTLKGEIKNVVTVVAKTTHYWVEHLSPEVKRSLAWETALQHLATRLRRWIYPG
jgi:sirohydrochlorin cobaltochelatase